VCRKYINVIASVNTHEDKRVALSALLHYITVEKVTEIVSLLDNFIPSINKVLLDYQNPEALEFLEHLSEVRPDLAYSCATRVMQDVILPKVMDDFSSQRVFLNWIRELRDVYAKAGKRMDWENYHADLVRVLKTKVPRLAYQIG
jgi:hypothetical protein